MTAYLGTARIHPGFLVAVHEIDGFDLSGPVFAAFDGQDFLLTTERRADLEHDLVPMGPDPDNEFVEVECTIIAGTEFLDLSPFQSQLEAIRLHPGVEFDFTGYGLHRRELLGEATSTPSAIGFHLMEELIGQLSELLTAQREEAERVLAAAITRRNDAIRGAEWAFTELRRLDGVLEQLKAEHVLLGETLLAEQRRRLVESAALQADIDFYVAQSGIDQDLIRDLLTFVDDQQITRLREMVRDIVAGAGLGGTLFGPLGAAAGADLGWLTGATSDRRTHR